MTWCRLHLLLLLNDEFWNWSQELKKNVLHNFSIDLLIKSDKLLISKFFELEYDSNCFHLSSGLICTTGLYTWPTNWFAVICDGRDETKPNLMTLCDTGTWHLTSPAYWGTMDQCSRLSTCEALTHLTCVCRMSFHITFTFLCSTFIYINQFKYIFVNLTY